MTRRLSIGALILSLGLAACGPGDDGRDAGPPVTADAGTPPFDEEGRPSCTRLVPLRLWTTNPSAVTFLYRAEHCDDGSPLQLVPSGEQALLDVYSLSENDSALSPEVVPRVSLSPGQEVYVSLLVDFSASTTAVKSELLDAVRQFAKTLIEETPKARVELRVFDGRAQPHTVVRPTRQLAELDAAMAKLREPSPGAVLGPNPDKASTNLNGAFQSGVEDLQRWQELVMSRNAGGIVTSGYLVVFTDGADTSEQVTVADAKATVAAARVSDGTQAGKPNVQTYAVALAGADFTPSARALLQELVAGEQPLGTYLLEGKLDELSERFTSLARRIAGEAEATHLLTYCSPARTGQRTVSLSASAAYGGQAAGATQVRFTFSAENFAPGCAEFLETVCEGKECGGFNCGACDDATETCRASDGRCVDECVSVNRCSGESFTNELGYERACGGDERVSKCWGQCVDWESDPQNCGGCGVRCAAGSVCQDGECACPPGTQACGGTCRTADFFDSNQNCGACGVSCGGGSTCTGGQCVCPGGDLYCSGACRGPAFFEDNTANCGTCGNACSTTGETCDAGRCVCLPGLGDCGGQCVSLNTRTDCGACGRTCAGGELCVEGGCQPDYEWARWRIPPESPSDYTSTDDTVTDNVTGLVWQRAVEAQKHQWTDARSYCAGLTLGGSSAWRLPTLIELESIVDRESLASAINVTAFPGTPEDHFWSSTPVAGDASTAWYVHFGGGWVGYGNATFLNYVRCVR